MKLKGLFLTLSLFTLLTCTMAQDDYYSPYKSHEKWFGSLNLGVNSFWGDINDNTNKLFPVTPFQSSFYKNRHFVLGGEFGKDITPFLTMGIAFKFANVSGKDYRTSREFYSYFNNEIVFAFTADILKLSKVRTNWGFYPRIGFGVYGFRTRLWNSNSGELLAVFPDYLINYELEQKVADKTPRYYYTFAIPFGVGVSYQLLPELTLYFETSMTWVNQDRLDAFSSDIKKFEGVWTSSLGVVYRFDFPVVRPKNVAGSQVYDPALKNDNLDKKYKRKKNRSSVIFKPAKSRTKSAVKQKRVKRKKFSIKNRE